MTTLIDSISVKNFKCLKDATAPLGLITVLVGPNNSGKSSLLQALMLLKQSLGQGGLSWNGPYVALGGFPDLVHAHDLSLELGILFVGRDQAARGKVFRTKEYLFQYELKIDGGGMRQHEGKVLLTGNGELSVTGLWDRTGIRNSVQSNLKVPEGFVFSFQPSTGVGTPFSGYLSQFPPQNVSHTEELRAAFVEIGQIFTKAIQRMFLVPAVRGVDRPDVNLTDAPVNDFLTVNGSDAQASNLASTLGYDPELAEKVSIFTRKITGSAIRPRLVPNKRTSIEALEPRFNSNLVNQGSGLNQLVFSFSQLSTAPQGSLVGIEEPELHLHPKAQGELVDALVEIAKSEDKQIVLTTHSEHILFRLLTKVARRELASDQLSVLRFDKQDAITSVISRLKIDPQGRIEGGLPGFFEEDIKEFQDYLNALQHSKKSPQ